MLTGFHLSFARTETDDWFDSFEGWMTLSPGFKFTVRRMVGRRQVSYTTSLVPVPHVGHILYKYSTIYTGCAELS
jgi:hypothetical protein